MDTINQLYKILIIKITNLKQTFKTNIMTQASVTTSNGIRTEVSKSAITLDELKVGENQKPGTITAQIRQKVTTKKTYPSKKVDSNLQDNLFSIGEFGFSGQDFISEENRVAWMPVPITKKKEEVEAMLAQASSSGATIYRVLSNEPILDNNQEYAIAAQLRSKDQFANTQVVRYPEGSVDELGVSNAGQLTLDKAGNVQYRRTFFSMSPKEDMDLRSADKVFMSAEIAAEVQGASVYANQQIS